ncbi:ABC transporter ATP-binding protein [Agrobacterium tumefaciens]|uniref:ABC transporter ATP-binding protein n=1 Tax=Agrobacterium tumefaciens TaxID=358 RepID=UPI003B9DCFB6
MIRPSLPRWNGILAEGSLSGFIWRVSRYHQIGVAALSIMLFPMQTVPLELQRRIVNTASQGGLHQKIVILVSIYAVISLLEGAVKLGLNLYRSWISEIAVRWLRLALFGMSPLKAEPTTDIEGVQLSIVIAEAEPIGSFVGDSLSQPLLQIGILTTVTGYLVYLQPLMALVILVVFLPQMAFVPAFQNAINKRVGQKTTLMRQVSITIVQTGGTVNEDGIQRSRLQTVFEISMGIYRIKFTMNFVMNLMTQLGYVGIMALGGYFVMTKQTEIGTVIAFLSSLAKINDPWGDLVDWYRNLRITQIKYELVKSILEIGRRAFRSSGKSSKTGTANKSLFMATVVPFGDSLNFSSRSRWPYSWSHWQQPSSCKHPRFWISVFPSG